MTNDLETVIAEEDRVYVPLVNEAYHVIQMMHIDKKHASALFKSYGVGKNTKKHVILALKGTDDVVGCAVFHLNMIPVHLKVELNIGVV